MEVIMIEMSRGFSAYQSMRVQEQFSVSTIKDSQDLMEQSVGVLLASTEAITRSVAANAANSVLMPGVGGVIDVYA